MTATPRQVDAIVVGAGPAGSAFAGELARYGFEPLVVDRARFPRAKACGESVNPGAVDALDRLGFLPAVAAARPATIRRWSVGDRRVRAVARVGRGGLGIERSQFDATLVEVIRARGIEVREGWRVVRLDRVGAEWQLSGRDGATASVVRAPLLVGADGLRSVVSRRLGLIGRGARRRKISFTYRVRGAGPLRDAGYLQIEPDLTVGLAPVHGDEPLWNATVVFDVTGWGRGPHPTVDFGECARRAISRAPFGWRDAPWIVGGPWVSGPFDRPVSSPAGDGVLLVGDAAGYFDPLTGQGIYRALRSAELAAAAAAPALAAGRVSAGALAGYARRWRAELRAPRAFQHAVDLALRHRLARMAAFRVMARWPALADRIVGVAGDRLPVRALFLPGAPAPRLEPTAP